MRCEPVSRKGKEEQTHSLASASSIACSFLHNLGGNPSSEAPVIESETPAAAAAAAIDDDHRCSPADRVGGRDMIKRGTVASDVGWCFAIQMTCIV